MLRRTSACLATAALVLSSLALIVSGAAPAEAAQPVPRHAAVVPETVRTNMPRITGGEITDLEYIGNRVFVAGTFTSIRNNASGNTTTYNQANLASFNLTTGLVDANFRPVFGGGGVTEVEASPDGTKLFVVGRFNTVNGVTKRKVASLNPTTGAPVAGFTAHANGAGTSVEATNTTVYIGGQYSTINGVRRVGLAAVNASTGALRTNFVNDLSGGIGVNGALTVQALVLTPDDSKLIVVHTARQIAGQNRYGVGIVSTQTNALLPWRSRLWEDNLVFVGGIQRAYAAAVSPDGSYFVVTSGSGGDRPPINDTAIRFNLNGDGADGMQPAWISRLFDSVYSVAISETAVYLGGHFNFMESPTAQDPWPGLDDVGYGKGQGLGGYGLGDDIVVRDHIGAIDPVKGKAIEWSPGSNSFEGNKAMLVHPRGVITGGDATTQGGQNVGRLAVYEFASVPAPGANETTIVTPIEGRVEEADVEFVLDGMATATSGVRRVQVEILERDTKRYLQDDLVTWGAANTINAELAAPNAGTTMWRLPLTIAGNHRIQAWARTVAVNGSTDASKASKKFETFGLSDQTPTTSISGPSGVIPTTTFIATGTAQDDEGVNAITFTLRDAANRYLQDDGTTDVTYNSFRSTPDVIGATSATWSYEVTVPYEGEWTMQATAVDVAGQSDLRSSDRTWIVSDTAIAPSVALTRPVSMTPPTANPPLTLAPGDPLTFSGSATDDEGLNFVEIQVRNTTTRENLAADGTWSTDAILGWHRISGVSNLPGTSYNWSWTTPFDLVPGTYTFAVRGEDDLGLTTSSTNQGKLTINVQVPGDAFPDGTITPGGTQPPLSSLHLDLAGAATDDRGVAAVRVSLRDSDSARYVQPDGTLSGAFALIDATLASAGATSTTWSLSLDLPAVGDYAVTVFAFDTANQMDPSTTGATARYLAYPGDQAPTVTENLLAPASGTVFTDARIFVSGRFEDDQQMARGEVAIRNGAGQYMSSTGAFTTTTETWVRTFLNSPGSPGSNFSYTTPAIPTGDYTVLVRGTDQNGFVTTPPITRTVTVAPPSSNPPVAGFTVACPAGTDPTNVCTFDGRTSTDESAATLTYAWNYGTGQGTGSGPVPKKTFTAAGTYTVTLTVRDEYGLTGTTTQTVTIAEPAGNVAPTPVINPPSCAALNCNLSAVGTADPNTGDTVTYRWDFGDGTPTSTSAAPAHAFPAAGTYTLTLTATDGWGKAATVTRSVTVTG